MRAWVIHGQPFGQRGIVEGLIGGNQGNWIGATRLMETVDFECHGELHGVIGAKRVLDPQACRIVQQGGSDLGDGVSPDEMLAKATEK